MGDLLRLEPDPISHGHRASGQRFNLVSQFERRLYAASKDTVKVAPVITGAASGFGVRDFLARNPSPEFLVWCHAKGCM